MSKHVIECVLFRLIQGTDTAAFTNAAADFNAWVTGRPGFIARSLSCTEDGEWIEHIEWASMDDAKAAAASIGRAEEARPFISAIDGSSVTMRHAVLEVTA
ncbi:MULTISPECIES: hypothetical protein [unclassified Sphingomonas]|uniref:hypothetical protein n=1 Tax=unclassified Sphingomonas TaxID=196159 RepID=UPI000BCFE489|nr:MAG: hypothetical protein B7Y98_09415 [Sphingomonas sp. 32-62-10]OYY63402.1 MAG: hypothetical protein B7Y49_13080 [Sphingomonas sp. 28-62-11]